MDDAPYIYVQINHPAIVGPSADESCISCIDTYLYSTIFPPQAKRLLLLRNPGAFIGQAVSPLHSCCASPDHCGFFCCLWPLENQHLGFYLPYLIWFCNEVKVHCPLFIDRVQHHALTLGLRLM